MKCPRCSADLEKQDFEGHSIEICRACGGMWLHKHQLNELLQNGPEDLEKCSIDTHPHQDDNEAIRCLNCKDVIMRKVNFLEYSDIIIDYCPQCGSFWIDKDELAAMHDYIDKVEKGSHEVKDFSAYNILAKISQIAYRIYH